MSSAERRRRVHPVYLNVMDGRLYRVLQIESASQADAESALHYATDRGWTDSMGGICQTGDPEFPFALAFTKEVVTLDADIDG
ncbi:hypothetical protein QU487_06655 [Crenobacter sp. SG2305]|uniref:hypothetical protein n=1 Tax=Crenobacter oryzisoli TaxID=3056844 RepID=UPI0025AB22C9|nr:hypothetical protein [Crenobacter sp. SG2305]MDN0082434.1 hypothetical protein [Crenobacter sp. SG2305]